MTNKYLRTIYGVDKDGKPGSLQVDVYNVLDAYPTKNPALDHLIKKALCPGQRGHKDLLTDLDDIIKSAQRAKELVVNQLACTTEVTISTEGPAVSRADQRVTSVKDGLGVRRKSTAEECIAVALDEIKDIMAQRPSTFTGKTLGYYPGKLHAEGLLKTFQGLAQDAGVTTKAIGRPDEVGFDGILIDGKDPDEQLIRHFTARGIYIYGVREANKILRGHIANAFDAPEERKTFRGEECLMKDLTAEGYCYSFSDRPESFDNAIIYVVEGVDPAALERLESEAGPCNTVIEYVRRAQDCPKGAIVIYDDHRKTPLVGDYWYHSIDKAITILVKDQKKVAAGPAAGRPTSFKGLKTIYAFPEKIKGRMPKLIEAVNGVCGLEYIDRIDEALPGSVVVGSYPLHEPMVDGRFTYGLAEALEILANDKKKDDTDA